MSHATTIPAPTPRPAAPPADSSTGSFAAISALGAAFAGLISHDRNPDVLVTGLAMGMTFVGAFVGLYVLRFVFRVTVAVTKVALPAAVILMVGCALDWGWAEHVSDWLLAAGQHGAHAASEALASWRAQ